MIKSIYNYFCYLEETKSSRSKSALSDASNRSPHNRSGHNNSADNNTNNNNHYNNLSTYSDLHEANMDKVSKQVDDMLKGTK
jgi:hypothetical protein